MGGRDAQDKQGKRAKRSGMSAAGKKFSAESVSTQSREWPVRAHTRTGDSRNRVGVSVGGQREVTVHVDQSFFARQTVSLRFFAKEFFHHDAVSYIFAREDPGIQNRNPGQFLSRYHSS